MTTLETKVDKRVRSTLCKFCYICPILTKFGDVSTSYSENP